MATTQVNEGGREIFRVVTAHEQREGGGFIVTRTSEVTAEISQAGPYGVTSRPACRPARTGRSSA